MSSVENLPKVAMILISIYLILFVLNKLIYKGKLFEMGCAKGFSNMRRSEWYRLFTGSFFHADILHLLGNVFAMYFVGAILENKIGSYYFLLIYLIVDIAESFVWSKVFTSAKSGCGASAGIYALIACILILYLQNPNLFNLDFGTCALNYLVWYFFLGNFIGLSGLIAHSLGFSFGIVGSMILLLAGVL